MQQPRLVIGIDLGTTNSLCAIRTGKGARVLRDRDSEPLIPSMVCFHPDGRKIVGREAKALRLTFPDRTVFSVKRLIGRAGEEVDAETKILPYPVHQGERGLARVRIGNDDWSPEQISALILRKVKSTAEQALGQEITAAVITVPAWFDDGQRQATKDAAALAGLECLRMINEPTAASLAYGIDGSKNGTVLVYDLGGGTFDVSILRIDDGVFRVLATVGDTHLGGDDFDRLLGDRILAAIGADARNPYVLQAVRAAAESLKCELSTKPNANLQLDLQGKQSSFSVTRVEFEAMIAPLVQRTLECCRRALKDAKLTAAQIDEVVLVGGSTRVPLVRQRLYQATGRQPNTGVDPDLAVALGAAIQADVLAGNDKSLLLLDVIPLSLGLETLGGAMQKIVLRNSTIPTSAAEEFSTAVDGQTSVALNIYQGERELVRDCRMLGSLTLAGLPPLPAGLPRIAVTFLVDADGVLRINAQEKRTGQEASILVVPSFGLTRDEVRRMMFESIEHAHADILARESIDLRNKAQSMVKGTKKALEQSDLPPDQTFAVQKSVKALEKLLAALTPVDLAVLKLATEELSKLTVTIADDVISSAVQKALAEEQREGKV
ncbi:MAG: Fe-S protein assembly chaperone HscA [Planctomycetes bacterium]|nr:Fe-S protein assembly chaperone HscA [Planctomycetota bacterium]